LPISLSLCLLILDCKFHSVDGRYASPFFSCLAVIEQFDGK